LHLEKSNKYFHWNISNRAVPNSIFPYSTPNTKNWHTIWPNKNSRWWQSWA